ncbi:MAG: hypothetical protein LC647_17960, partial [Beggiatoa sp.]|nr:hypothetical protein [Beggiatoa sp.]
MALLVAGCGSRGGVDAAEGFANRWRGKKKALAMSVGTTALPMTVATRNEYCAWSMTWWLSP